MFKAYRSYWKNFWNFRDRTSLGGYWWVVLMNAIIEIALFVIMYRSIVGSGLPNPLAFLGPVAPVAILISWPVLNLIPGVALAIRRLHDIGRSGLSYLFAFIPIAGVFIMLLFLTSPTKDPPGNRYGYRPSV